MKQLLFILRIAAALLLTLAAFALAVGALRLFSYAETAVPVIEDGENGPTQCLTRFFNALEEKDFDAAYACLSDGQSLGLEQEPEDALSLMLWQAQQDAWRAEIAEGYDMRGTQLIKRVTIQGLDSSALVAPVHELVQEALAQAVEEAALESDIYNDDGSYRDEVVLVLLEQTVRTVLKDPTPFLSSWELDMKLEHRDGSWFIVPDAELIYALSGGTVR